ncbi:MAG: hypothetical protein CMO74_02940 [Verrucomicrobiales bacterium]|nr:hypothetical protein [Verrucomicrobiales bacterium]
MLFMDISIASDRVPATMTTMFAFILNFIIFVGKESGITFDFPSLFHCPTTFAFRAFPKIDSIEQRTKKY